jgi:hypothetical protein
MTKRHAPNKRQNSKLKNKSHKSKAKGGGKGAAGFLKFVFGIFNFFKNIFIDIKGT